MPCLFSNCAKEELPGSSRWGFSQGVCEYHYAKAKDAALNSKAPGTLSSNLQNDYAKLWILFEDKLTVERCLRLLANELSTLEGKEGYAPNTPGKGHLKLSAALERYESFCWFPNCRDTFIEQLTAEEFFSYLARGLMAKDPGAGVNHGDYTHRLHWHICARIITSEFTTPKREGWHHSPLRLYTSLGDGPGRTLNVWTNLFEVQKGTYHFPDTLHAHVVGGGYGALSVNVARRFEKRSQEFTTHYDKQEANKLNDGLSETRGDRTRGKHEWYKLDSIEKTNAAYAARQRLKHTGQEPNDPIIRKGTPEFDIASLLASSDTGFAKTNKDPKENLTFSKKLGMLKLFKANRNLQSHIQ